MNARNNAFFQQQIADRLMDPANHPDCIRAFLRHEEMLVAALSGCFDVLMELGCHDGRYLPWAINHGKRYIGIDVAPRHVAAGRARARRLGATSSSRFLIQDVVDLGPLAERPSLHQLMATGFVLLPFGLLGALSDVGRVIDGLRHLGLPFLVSVYQSGRPATECRREYYSRCGLPTQVIVDSRGVQLSTKCGFHSSAYYPEFLVREFGSRQVPVLSLKCSVLNLAVVSAKLWPALEYVLPSPWRRSPSDTA